MNSTDSSAGVVIYMMTSDMRIENQYELPATSEKVKDSSNITVFHDVGRAGISATKAPPITYNNIDILSMLKLEFNCCQPSGFRSERGIQTAKRDGVTQGIRRC